MSACTRYLLTMKKHSIPLTEMLFKSSCANLDVQTNFVKVLKSFRTGMQVRVSANGDLSESFKVKLGFKQGDVIAPALFSLYFPTVFRDPFAR